MNVENLVSMANQIGQFFDAMPDHEEALEGISNHLRKFWAPRMREALTTRWEAGGEGLSPIVHEAIGRHPIRSVTQKVSTIDPVKAAERHAFDGTTES